MHCHASGTFATMKTAVYSAHRFEQDYFNKAASGKHELVWIEARLTETTAILAEGCKAVCIFVNDDASENVLKKLYALGIKNLVLRSAGFNHVDIKAAGSLGIRVARVPEYSPYAVAEHTVALMMALNRRIVKAHNRIREGNFSLDGLTGFDMHGKTVGIVGFGKIGKCVASIVHGFGCNIIVYDPAPETSMNKEFNFRYEKLDTLFKDSDIITLHAPLSPETKYLVNKVSISNMKRGVMLINTGRGGLVNTKDVIAGLKSGQIGYVGLDVYEEEQGLFFEDHSAEVLQDDTIARLTTFQNVLITSHQAFLTDTALYKIAEVTVGNLDAFENGLICQNELKS
jgi:D-lactate dehydrogenase